MFRSSTENQFATNIKLRMSHYCLTFTDLHPVGIRSHELRGEIRHEMQRQGRQHAAGGVQVHQVISRVRPVL